MSRTSLALSPDRTLHTETEYVALRGASSGVHEGRGYLLPTNLPASHLDDLKGAIPILPLVLVPNVLNFARLHSTLNTILSSCAQNFRVVHERIFCSVPKESGGASDRAN